MSSNSEPKEIIKNKIVFEMEKDLRDKFFKRGIDYLVDYILIGRLYDVHSGIKIETIVNSYEDKVEVAKAYPKFFNFTQVGVGYKITKNTKNI
mgnify:CR=1 FL=1|tara:strand:+ start:61 stop:339 length:279 start_codon:yes stop_codon:yes gene_type:complete